MAVPRFLASVAGRIKMIATVATSAGATDADKIPSTNASGVLDPTLLNAATTGANKIPLLDGSGRLDPSTMPTGIGQDAASIVASETIAAGALVNVWNNSGTPNVRNADGTAEGKEANGFVLAGVSASASATVFFEGRITGLTGLTPGARQYLSASTPGTATATAPTTAGNVVQYIGVAVSASSIDFEASNPITVA